MKERDKNKIKEHHGFHLVPCIQGSTQPHATRPTYHGQPAAWNAGEVVVLIVVAHIEGEKVERAVVGIGLVALEEHVMLSDEVARDRVKAHAQHGAGQHVDHRLGAPQPVEGKVEGELDGHVGQLQLRDGLGVDAEWADGIEEWLQNDPEELADARAEEPTLKVSGDVHIDAVATQVAVVVQVVALEGGRVGQANGQVGKHGEPAVELGPVVAKGRVVGDLVDGQRHGVVDATAKYVSPEEHPLPFQVLHEVERQKLNPHHHAYDPLQTMVRTHQRFDLWILSCWKNYT